MYIAYHPTLDDESEDEAATNGKVTDHDSGAEVDAQNAKKKKGLKSKKGQILVRASNKTAPTVPKVSKKKATTTADNTKDSKTEDSKTEDSKTEDSETEKMETMEVDEDVPPTEAVKAEEDSTKPIETDEKVEETEKKPRKPRKVHNAADMKDKFWRDVSKMTEAQKNKYFKSKAIRKFVKVNTTLTFTCIMCSFLWLKKNYEQKKWTILKIRTTISLLIIFLFALQTTTP